ncbi:MAG: YbaK/EbsC family protein [Actinomycetota bacterium]|nr:YbaK/EbsC family protein [Actinomycetota bacterium]
MRTSVDVHNYLVERDIPHEVFLARGRLRSPEQIALVLDLPQDEVGKVVIYEGEGPSVAAVLPVGCRALANRVQQVVDTPNLHRATSARSAEITDFLADTIPPAGLPRRITIVVDESLARDDVLYFPGGEPRAVLKIRGKDLVTATRAIVAPIASKRAA